MRGIMRIGLLMFMAVIVLICFPQLTADAAKGSSAVNRYNVVFVMDVSGSMDDTDRDNLRYDAAELFLGLAADSGNYAGSVMFSLDVVKSIGIAEVSGFQEKQELVNAMRTVEVGGATDIGKAILEAVRMLERSRNEELPSVIILLTDGNTDLGMKATQENLAQSWEYKDEAVSIARQKGYPIYSVCLNADGRADKHELEKISEETGGECLEVARPEDIKEVFNRFYELIYDAETIMLADEKIPKNGVLEKEFKVPMFGVEELNIIISTLSYETTFDIWKPSATSESGFELLEENDGQSVIRARSFSVTKIVDPKTGWWKLTVNGIPGDDIRVTMVYNAEYEVVLEGEEEYHSGCLNDSIVLKARLLEDGSPILDEDAYLDQEENVVLFVTHDNETSKLDMNARGCSYEREYELKDYGSYFFVVEMQVDGMRQQSKSLQFEVINRPPVVLQDEPEWKLNVWLPGEKAYSYDLSEMTSDAEDGIPRFYVEDSEGYAVEASEDGILSLIYGETADVKSLLVGGLQEKFIIALKAVDDQGASCDLALEVKVVRIYRALARAAGTILIFIVIASAVLIWKAKHRPFKGTAQIAGFDYARGIYGNYEPMVLNRGKQRLLDFISNGYGVDVGRVWLVASRKDYIFLKGSRGYFGSDDQDRRRKRIKLENGCETIISDREDLQAGVKIIWQHDEEQFNYMKEV